MSDAKVETSPADRIGSASSPGLRRKELTEDGKRWQLWGKGVKGVEAEEIIAKIYGDAP